MSVLWLQRQESNPQLSAYEADELPLLYSARERRSRELRQGEIKNECVEQKKGDKKWKAEGGGKGVRMWNTPESHNLFRLLSYYHCTHT